LFSALLSLRPAGLDAVFFGRLILLVASILCFVVFVGLVDRFMGSSDSFGKRFTLWLFVFNPVFLYWSIRVMADIPFSLIALFGIFLFTVWLPRFSNKRVFFLGLLAGLASLTRFEGFLLFCSLGLGLLYSEGIDSFRGFGKILSKVRDKFSLVSFYLVGFFLVALPYFVFRNPFGSSYFEEPAGRIYDVETVLIYVVSLLFIFGVIPAFFFTYKNKKKVLEIFKKNVALSAFVCTELILVLLWPAAVPRLFVSVVPFLLIFFGISVDGYFKKSSMEKPKRNWMDLAFMLGLLLIYVISQYYLKLQFLLVGVKIIFLVSSMQLSVIFSAYFKKNKLFLVATVFSAALWSFWIIRAHKDIFYSVKNSAAFAARNLSGKVAYNDASSVSDWYLNYAYAGSTTKGFYYNINIKNSMQLESLNERSIDYLIITNEHNPAMEIDFSKRPYLVPIRTFEYTTGGTNFFAKILRVEKGY
jgi:hypothetical protein